MSKPSDTTPLSRKGRVVSVTKARDDFSFSPAEEEYIAALCADEKGLSGAVNEALAQSRRAAVLREALEEIAAGSDGRAFRLGATRPGMSFGNWAWWRARQGLEKEAE